MIKLDIDYKVLNANYQFIRTKHNSDKVLVFEKNDLLFVFNWHPTQSYESYPIYTKNCRKASVLWSTDDGDFGGHGRVYHQAYKTEKVDDFVSKFLLYLPNRCAIIFNIHHDEEIIENHN
jgi:1,4-alpha-glucan branching enzyme